MATKRYIKNKNIYIPIWLDLLFEKVAQRIENNINLHSNMVRFIMFSNFNIIILRIQFTFQYG